MTIERSVSISLGLDLLIAEDRTEGCLNVLRQSTIPLKQIDSTHGSSLTLGNAGQEVHQKILEQVTSALDPEHQKYIEYFITQVALGNLSPDVISQRSVYINRLLSMFVKVSRKPNWKKVFSPDIYRYQFQALEAAVFHFASEDSSYVHNEEKDSEILFKKSYRPNHAKHLSLLLGVDDSTTYILRKILTPRGAEKYGKGTTWCTNTELPPKYLLGIKLFH